MCTLVGEFLVNAKNNMDIRYDTYSFGSNSAIVMLSEVEA